MLHEVRTAVKGELVPAQLPPYAGEKRVRAAQIVATGLGSQPGTTRLALTGGAHVDVGKAFLQRHGSAVGHYYVQNPDDTTEIIDGHLFESSYTPTEEDPVPTEEPVADTAKLEAELKGAHSLIERLTNERDGARSRITELEKELAAAKAEADKPSAADLDAAAGEQAAKDATTGS